MNSKFLELNVSDVTKGLVLAVIVVILGALQQMVTAHGWDFASYDWSGIISIAVKAGGAYLIKNLLSSDGKVLGKIG